MAHVPAEKDRLCFRSCTCSWLFYTRVCVCTHENILGPRSTAGFLSPHHPHFPLDPNQGAGHSCSCPHYSSAELQKRGQSAPPEQQGCCVHLLNPDEPGVGAYGKDFQLKPRGAGRSQAPRRRCKQYLGSSRSASRSGSLPSLGGEGKGLFARPLEPPAGVPLAPAPAPRSCRGRCAPGRLGACSTPPGAAGSPLPPKRPPPPLTCCCSRCFNGMDLEENSNAAGSGSAGGKLLR